ncbi:hypothetical protein F4774DRAFT_422423 [Daldinia eschscholtzii]|nr:hypothetical protein F4774DRAFT_422423 [Daldinia eschscholtzii]
MDLPMSEHSTLNPAAPWWYPMDTGSITIADDCIVVNAQALDWFNRVLKPAPSVTLARAISMLEVGIDGNLILTAEGLCNVYADFAQSLPRHFDMSLSLIKTAKIRQYLYEAICFNSTNPKGHEDIMRPHDIVIAMRTISCLNDLVKRILSAERSGNFVPQFLGAKYRITIWQTDTTLSDLESSTSRYLESLKWAGVTNGTMRPYEFTPFKRYWDGI